MRHTLTIPLALVLVLALVAGASLGGSLQDLLADKWQEFKINKIEGDKVTLRTTTPMTFVAMDKSAVKVGQTVYVNRAKKQVAADAEGKRIIGSWK